MVSNGDHSLEIQEKQDDHAGWAAGHVPRGVAMNPVDHPMGGGEGRATGGHPRSRKGTPAKATKPARRKMLRINISLKEERSNLIYISIMSRSLKKGPFIDYKLEKKFIDLIESKKKVRD